MARRFEVDVVHYSISDGGREMPFSVSLILQSRYMPSQGLAYVRHGVSIKAGEKDKTIIEPYELSKFENVKIGDKLYIIGYKKAVNGEATIRAILQ